MGTKSTQCGLGILLELIHWCQVFAKIFDGVPPKGAKPQFTIKPRVLPPRLGVIRMTKMEIKCPNLFIYLLTSNDFSDTVVCSTGSVGSWWPCGGERIHGSKGKKVKLIIKVLYSILFMPWSNVWPSLPDCKSVSMKSRINQMEPFLWQRGEKKKSWKLL